MKKIITHGTYWEKEPKGTYFISDHIKFVIPIIKKNKKIKKILDLACGNGLGASIPLIKNGYDVYGYELFQSAVKAYKHNLSGQGFKPKIKRGNMHHKLKFNNNSFDCVLCLQAIYHGKINQIIKTFKEIKRILKKKGTFFITFMRFEDLKHEKDKFFWRIKKKNIKVPYRQDKKSPHLMWPASHIERGIPHYFFTKKELEEVLGKIFREVKIKVILSRGLMKFWLVYGRK